MSLIQYFQISIGIACFIVGGVDESLGLQGVGIAVIAWNIFRLIRASRNDL